MRSSFFLFMMIIKMLFSFIICLTTTLSYSQNFGLGPTTNSANQQSFEFKPNQSGSLASNVNLYTGDVGFPINLASLSGRNGLNYDLTISYTSNVHTQANTWNTESPTGVVGLGWSLDYPKILANNKMTGTRDDDTYYIKESGAYNEFIYAGESSGIKEYKTRSHQFWVIKYFAVNDRWEITKEDGTKFIYGDKNSGRSTIQWIVAWHNWIGNSSKDGSLDQRQQALVWNLSEVRSVWNEALVFSYLNVNQKVGGVNGKEQTEASYLQTMLCSSNKCNFQFL